MGIKLKITVSTFWLSSKVLKPRNIRTFYTHTQILLFYMSVVRKKMDRDTFHTTHHMKRLKDFSLP